MAPQHQQATSAAGSHFGAPSAASHGAPSGYGGINSLLGQLHSERVRAGARQRWVEDADEDEEEDW